MSESTQAVVTTPAPVVTTFKDTTGTEHDLKITWGTAMRLKDAGVIDIFTLFADGQKKFIALMSNPLQVLDVVAAILGIPKEKSLEFASKIDGRVGLDMGTALTRACADFSPGLIQDTLLAGLERATALEEAAAAEVVAEINKIDPQAIAKQAVANMGTKIAETMNNLAGSKSGQPPALNSGSTQPDTIPP
ncbi:MAG TPA: hypothetical protein VFE62_26610, partial [Gemmataceae bacterium]|nr:hypothetical protein [Gemmataceae bacterium]